VNDASGLTIVELPYHRLYRAQPTYRWWRPLVAVLMTAVFFLGVSILLAIPVFLILLSNGTIDLASPVAQDDLIAELTPDMANPWTIAFGLLSIILVMPTIPLALRIAGIRPTGVRVNILHSVAFRLRWRWLGVTLIPAAVVWGVTFVGQVGFDMAFGEGLLPFSTDLATYLVSVALVIVLVPLQAATEEYLYRGVLLQSIGSWLRWAPFGVIISATVFAFSHAYDGWGILQVALIGVAFAYATVRTGGLEAAIAFHAVNNIGVFVVTGTGMFGPTGITSDTGGPWAVVAQLVTVALWVLALEWFARRHRIERLSRIGVPSPAPAAPPPSAS
jgi:membrane protease YdiL (CAAX protease family)